MSLRPIRAAHAAALACAFFAVSCSRQERPAGVDPSLAACVPASTLALAGVDLAALRASPLSRSLPAAAAAALEPLRDATYVLAGYDGKSVLIAAMGKFREAPSGTSLLSSEIAVAGSPEFVAAARAQLATGKTGAGWLLARAPSPAEHAVWAVAVGGMALPVTGNAANLNPLLQLADYASVSLSLGERPRIELGGAGRDAASAARLEETLRAFLSLGARAPGVQPSLASPLRAAEVVRSGLAVRASIVLTPEQTGALLGLIPR